MSSVAHHAGDPFRLLVESVVEYAIFMLDPAGNIASWNPGAERIYRYSAEDILGEPFSSFYTPDDVAAGLPEHARHQAVDMGNFEQDGVRVRRGGSQFWAVNSISNLRDPFGNHAGLSVVTRDMTENKVAEEAIRRERDISAAILASLPGVYYMYDESGHFLRWNRRFELVTEYTAEEIARLHPLDLFEGDDKRVVSERIRKVFDIGRDEVEATFVSRNGQRTPYFFNGVRAEIVGQRCLLGMGMDISAHRRAESALRTADERMRLAAGVASLGLWDWDWQTNQVFYSAEWKRQIGYAENEIGETFDEWERRVHPEDLELAMQRMRNFIANPASRYEAEFRLRHRDGSYRWILSKASLLFDENNKPVRMLGFHIDVTEQRELGRQLQQAQKMEAIGQLAGGVAHDFNNLLMIITGCSEVLLQTLPLDHPKRALLDEIRKAAERSASLTRQLLAFSRKQTVAPRVLDLNAIVAETEKMLRRVIGEDIQLSTKLDSEIGPVKADAGQLEQVLLNLAVNARDAMPLGGKLMIETCNAEIDAEYCAIHTHARPGPYVAVAVTDSGTGMTDEIRRRLFEPFFTTKESGKGTGLGLAIVHDIVKQGGGFVDVLSEPGVGTCFKIYLPRVAETETKETPGDTGAGPAPRGTETIILVEDEDAVRALTRFTLQDLGYAVLDAADGAEAINLVSEYRASIQLLITDVVMPGIGGRVLAEKLLVARPGLKVLYLSGYTDAAVVRHGIIHDEVNFLQKPFSPTALAFKVRDALTK